MTSSPPIITGGHTNSVSLRADNYRLHLCLLKVKGIKPKHYTSEYCISNFLGGEIMIFPGTSPTI